MYVCLYVCMYVCGCEAGRIGLATIFRYACKPIMSVAGAMDRCTYRYITYSPLYTHSHRPPQQKIGKELNRDIRREELTRKKTRVEEKLAELQAKVAEEK